MPCRLLSSFGQDVQGTLPAELDRLTALQQLSIVGQGFSGRLPASWGADGGFGELQLIDISQNQLSSTLPAEWGAPDRCEFRDILCQLYGYVPVVWWPWNAVLLMHVTVERCLAAASCACGCS